MNKLKTKLKSTKTILKITLNFILIPSFQMKSIKSTKFIKNFLEGGETIQSALLNYVRDVKSMAYPSPEHCFE